MCYLPPGPRCSNHAHKELVHALQAVERETDVNRKIVLQLKADDAQKSYYTTPRGQNDLKREIALLSGSNDMDARVRMWELKRELLVGEETRKKQLDDYNRTTQLRSSEIKEVLPTRNKNEIATAITLNTILEHSQNSSWDVHVKAPNLIEVNSEEGSFTVLALPDKYQTIWDTFTTNIEGLLESDNPLPDVEMAEVMAVFNTNLTFSQLDEATFELLSSWIQAKLKSFNIKLIASVDRRTENIQFFNPEEILDFYTPDFKLAKRLGGTTQFKGAVEELEALLTGTVFEAATVHQIKDDRGRTTKTILLDVPPQPEKLRSVSGLYLSWHEQTEGGYYEVRSKHLSSRFNLKVVFSKKERTQTQSSLSALNNLLPAPVAA